MAVRNPLTILELSEELARASAQGERGLSFNLAHLDRVREYNPADMTVTVETGLTLAALQQQLAKHGQWLPVDPPNPHVLTIAELLQHNASGPRRLGYGTIREHLLGLAVVLADGRLVHSGGKVVKNVAGYDLCKLFVGSQGSLGVIVEATFKVRPLPEAEKFVGISCESLAEAGAVLEAIHTSELTPVVLDAWGGTVGAWERSRVMVVLGVAGRPEEVDWQLAKAAPLGLRAPADLEYERIFWGTGETPLPHHVSVLPSRLAETLQTLGAEQFVARAGNGVIYYRGGNPPSKAELPAALIKRIKETYDPNGMFRELDLR